VGAGEVGRFANGRVQAPFYFRLNGDLPYVHLLFADIARTGAPARARGDAEVSDGATKRQ
jgi:hypothetical protein